MQQGKYKQNIHFWGILGALFGSIDGIFINILFKTQLNDFFLKLAYLIVSINFHAIVGVIIGLLFGFGFTLLKSEKLETVFFKAFLLLLLFGYFGFYANIFLLDFNKHFKFSTLINFQNLTDEIILLPFTLIVTSLLFRIYKKIPFFNRIEGKSSIMLKILAVAFMINVVSWLTLGQDEPDSVDASIITQRAAKKVTDEKFQLPDSFIPPKNLIIVVIDTLRADHLGCYGYSLNTSPFIDRLSRKSVLFENFIVQKPKTSPSIASLFTSLYVQEHGIVSCGAILPDKYFTLAESFLKNGFKTQSFIGNGTIASIFNFNQGFTNYIHASELVDKGLADDVNHGVYVGGANWLAKEGKKSFFLYLHFRDPHAPYAPPEKFDVFPPDMEKSPIIPFRSIPSYALLEDHRELDYYISKYDAEIRYSDHLIGKLFEKLDQLKLLQNTLIILTADHGESLGEHGYYFDHGLFTYDACARVPFLLYYPRGNFPVQRIPQPMEMIDVFPTVHEMLRVPYDKDKISGRSFIPVLLGKKQKSKKVFLESGYTMFKNGDHCIIYTIRDDCWKLIFNHWRLDTHQLFSFEFFFNIYRKIRVIFSASIYPPKPKYELYDLKKDPQETRNLYQPDSQIALSLIRELKQKIDHENRNFISMVDTDLMDQKTKRELKALGYIQ